MATAISPFENTMGGTVGGPARAMSSSMPHTTYISPLTVVYTAPRDQEIRVHGSCRRGMGSLLVLSKHVAVLSFRG